MPGKSVRTALSLAAAGLLFVVAFAVAHLPASEHVRSAARDAIVHDEVGHRHASRSGSTQVGFTAP